MTDAGRDAGTGTGERRARHGGGRMRRVLVGLVARLHRWAESGWAGSAVATWGVLQGSVMPGPADTLLLPLGIADPRRVWRLAAYATAGAVVGGIVAYLIGAFAFEDVGRRIFALVGVGDEGIVQSRRLFDRWGWAFVLVSAVTPISTKLVCIAAGAFGVPFVPFVVALAGGRGGRFAVVATIVHFAGARLERYLRRRFGRGPEELH